MEQHEEEIVDRASFSIEYSGKPESIDAFTFLLSVGGICEALREINRACHPDTKLNIELRSSRPGSFIVDLDLIGQILSGLIPFFPDGISIAANTFSMLVSFMNIRRFLKGEEPVRVEIDGRRAVITNSDGHVKVYNGDVYNFYVENPKVQDQISKTFESLENDPSVEEFNVRDEEGRHTFKAGRDEFPYLSTVTRIEKGEKIRKITAVVHVVKLAFEPNYKWLVVFQGEKISASIEDKGFFEKIDKGELQFSKGDALEVELEIRQVFDSEVNTYVNKSYGIKRIIRHLPRHKQLTLEYHFGDEGKLD